MIRRALRVVAALAVTTPVVALPTTAHADEIRDSQWHLDYLNIAEAHQHSRGGDVIVAVVDSGIDASHPDLENNVLPGLDIRRDADETDDGREDTDGHGTAMAGLIAAHGHGAGEGALGIAPEAKILPIRHDNGLDKPLDPENAHASIEWAINQGARVINMSISGVRRADIERAHQADVVVVVAAGNRPTEVVPNVRENIDGMIQVAAVDRNGDAGLSPTGPTITLAAPATDICSTRLNGSYSCRENGGSSSAAAIVSGAVALVRAKFPELSAAEVIHRLTYTAIDKGPAGRDDEYGYGIIDIVAALTADVPPLNQPEPTEPTDESPEPGASEPPTDAGDSRTGTSGPLVAGALVLVVLIVGAALLAQRARRTD